MSIVAEFQKLKKILSGTHYEGSFNPGASADDLAALEKTLGYPIAGGLRELWLLANGAQYRHYGTPIFGVWTDRASPCGFLSVQEAAEWSKQSPSDEDFEGYEETEPRDARIRPGWSNARWLPFAQFNGRGTVVYYDADPGPGGRAGQIIAYQHDPDAMHFIADTFETFFAASNRLLTKDKTLIEWIREP